MRNEKNGLGLCLGSSRLATHDGAFLLGCLLRNLRLHACQFGVDQDASAIFAGNNLLARTNINLTLRGNLVETATASTTLNVNHGEAIALALADALESGKQTGLHTQFDAASLLAQTLFLGARLCDDFVELCLFHIQVLDALLDGRTTTGEV